MKQLLKRLHYYHRRGGYVAPVQANGARVFVAASSQRMEYDDPSELLSLKATGWSMAFFVKRTTVSGVQVLISKDNGAAARNFLIYTIDADVFFFASGDQATIGTFTINQWYFVVVWFNPDDNKLYASLDNAAATSSGAIAVQSNTGKFIFGNNQAAAGHADMHIAKVVISDEVWTPTERTWLHNGGSGQLYSAFGEGDGAAMLTNLNAYLPGNESSGNMLDMHGSFEFTDVNGVTAASGPP